jgi:hypothetical protein
METMKMGGYYVIQFLKEMACQPGHEDEGDLQELAERFILDMQDAMIKELIEIGNDPAIREMVHWLPFEKETNSSAGTEA